MLKGLKLGADRWVELFLSFAICAVAAVQLFTTISNNKGTSEQTNQLITAAGISAHAATQNVQASRNFSESARGINEGVSEAVDKLNLQAATTRGLVEQAVRQARATNDLAGAERSAAITAANQLQTVQQQFQASQRPWLSLNVSGVNQLVIRGHFASIYGTHFTSTNFGNSIAKTVLYRPVLVAGMGNSGTGKECEYSRADRENWERGNAGTVAFPRETIEGENPVGVSIDQPFQYALVACISYTSPVDDLPHWTRVVYWVVPKDHSKGFTSTPGTYDVELIKALNSTQAY